ncbi:MAG: hypothetical protein ACEQSR_03745 [Candidatus Methylacidiphilales bacterium]
MCCIDIIKLGCFDSCLTTIDTGIVVALVDTGTWKMVVEYGGVHHSYSFEVLADGKVIIPNVFNENYVHHFKLIKPDFTMYNASCYQIKTQLIWKH